MRRLLLRGAERLLTPKATRPGFVFIHLPKCGGTAVTQAVEAACAPVVQRSLDYQAAKRAGIVVSNSTLFDTGQVDDLEFLQYLLSYRLSEGARFTAGHYPVSARLLQAHAPQYNFVTVLRDPLARWTSTYLWNKRLPDPDGTNLPSINYDGSAAEEFDRVVSSGMGLLMGSTMTAMLAGAFPKDGADATALSDIAANNLGHFAVVGFQDHMDDFASEVGAVVGTPVTIPSVNQTQDRYSDELELLAELRALLAEPARRAKILELCSADRRLYSTAQDMRTS